MRRSEKEITDRARIDDIIRRSLVCRLALVDEGMPYLVPLSFGYDGECLYLHSASEGRKIRALRRDRRVSFEFDVDCEPLPAEQACHWGMRYRSVIGCGRAEFVVGPEEKRTALQVIVAHYSGAATKCAIGNEETGRTEVIRIRIDSLTGKQSGW